MISIFARMGRLLITLVIGFILLVAIVAVGIPLLLSAFGYWVNPTATEIAEMAAEKKDINQCRRLISYGLFAPPTGEKRRVCIRIFAELTKDPFVCELLMPSSYGMSCIGGARSVPQPCFLKSDLSVGGNGIKASLKECVSGQDDIQNNACCIISRVSSIIGQDDCSSLNDNPEMYDQCLNELAFKKKDPSICQNIASDNTRSACDVQTKAIRENPSICSGCTPAISLEAASAL